MRNHPLVENALRMLGFDENNPEPTPAEVRGAYRKLALKYHPDKSSPEKKQENEEMFKMVQTAHDTLVEYSESPEKYPPSQSQAKTPDFAQATSAAVDPDPDASKVTRMNNGDLADPLGRWEFALDIADRCLDLAWLFYMQKKEGDTTLKFDEESFQNILGTALPPDFHFYRNQSFTFSVTLPSGKQIGISMMVSHRGGQSISFDIPEVGIITLETTSAGGKGRSFHRESFRIHIDPVHHSVMDVLKAKVLKPTSWFSSSKTKTSPQIQTQELQQKGNQVAIFGKKSNEPQMSVSALNEEQSTKGLSTLMQLYWALNGKAMSSEIPSIDSLLIPDVSVPSSHRIAVAASLFPEHKTWLCKNREGKVDAYRMSDCVLKDGKRIQANNSAIEIKRVDNDRTNQHYFEIAGENASRERRFVRLHDDGSVTGFSGAKLGVVEKQLYDNRSRIIMVCEIPREILEKHQYMEKHATYDINSSEKLVLCDERDADFVVDLSVSTFEKQGTNWEITARDDKNGSCIIFVNNDRQICENTKLPLTPEQQLMFVHLDNMIDYFASRNPEIQRVFRPQASERI